jgi:hypothetical protein
MPGAIPLFSLAFSWCDTQLSTGTVLVCGISDSPSAKLKRVQLFSEKNVNHVNHKGKVQRT